MNDSQTVTLKQNDSVTPSQEVINRAKKPIEIVDSLGRKIILERPSVLKTAQIASFLGEDSSNLGFLAIVTPFYFVVSVNKIPTPVTSRLDLEALMEELGHPGRDAVTIAIEKFFADEINVVADGQDVSDTLEKVKK